MYRARIFSLLIALGLLSCGDAGVDSDWKVASAEFSLEEEVTNQSRLVLEAVNGNITITGVSGADAVTIEGTREVRADTLDAAQQGLGELQVNVESFAEEIVVETVQPKDDDVRNFVVTYEILVPSSLTVVVRTANGDIGAINVAGSLSVQLANGDVEARITLPPGGFTDIASANGNIDLFVPANTSATFSAFVGNGNIKISNLDLQNSVTTDRAVIGVLREGDGAITLGTGNGRITATGF